MSAIASRSTAAASGRAATSPLVTAAFLILAIGVLYVGREIFIPLALATLLSFLLAPLSLRLRRWGLGRVPSVALAATLAVAVIGALALLVGSQIVQLANNLPFYEQNIRAKIQSINTAAPDDGVLGRAAALIEDLGEELKGGSAKSQRADAAPEPAAGARERPLPVQVVPAETSPIEVIQSVALPLLAPVGVAGLVVVFVVFMLLEREDLRDRMIRLIGGADLNATTEALDEAARRVGRYLLMQLVVNATYGLPIGVGLYLIGVPNALLWGVLATILRFVPYLGPFIAALFPIALAFAVDPGWSMVLWTIALFLGAELISNNLVEPWLYGASTGLSSVAIVVSAIFWTLLWGPAGLLLATPLTVCLAVIGRYAPQLGFLDVLLGSEPVLSPAERFYQRMLAGDWEEGEEIAAEVLKERPLAAFYDEVALPALRLAEADRHRKVLSPDRAEAVAQSVERVVAELAEDDAAGADENSPDEPPRPPVIWAEDAVLSLAGRTPLDRAAAAILAQLLGSRGIGCRVAPALSPTGMARQDGQAPQLVCLSYLGGSGVAQAKMAMRRLRRRMPRAKFLVGLWNAQIDLSKESDPAAELSVDFVANGFAQAVETIESLACAPIDAPMAPAPIPVSEEARLAALARLNVLDTPPDERLDAITHRLAETFGAPIALVSLIDERRQFWKSASGLPADLAEARAAPRETSICGHVVAGDEPLFIEDVLKDKRFANNPFLRERNVRFYAGTPLRTADGMAIGSLCVIDTKPRAVSQAERSLLQVLADEAMRIIEGAAPAADADQDQKVA